MDKQQTFSDDDLLNALRRWSNGCMTYVARNILAEGHPNLKTATVLRRLKKLEREGKVRRVPSCYAAQLCWGVPGVHPSANRCAPSAGAK